MLKVAKKANGFDWRDLSQDAAWREWREAKIRAADRLVRRSPAMLDSLSNPNVTALAEIEQRCAVANFAVYQVATTTGSVKAESEALMRLAHQIGFTEAEVHRSAGVSGVVALRISSEMSKRDYIPYTSKSMNWHTDGYYNALEQPVKSFILHCYQQAPVGGENQLLDPEIAYLRLRERNPEFVRALMHPEALTVPQNREFDGRFRPASVGPVFLPDPGTGRLQMRYTARTRSIQWRNDKLTLKAADWLREWLMVGDPLMVRVRLSPGQGIVSNNVLHNRTAFEDGEDEDATRVMLRVRFHKRVAEDNDGATK
jgi:hypothetical protein